MAIVGGAVITLVQGTFADAIGLHHSFVLPVVCYLFITFYGLKGYRADALALEGATAGVTADQMA
jgi:FHS family L-fucose permease-like MFS transporter